MQITINPFGGWRRVATVEVGSRVKDLPSLVHDDTLRFRLVEADSPRRTVSEGLAGIEAIAAGRDSASGLVRDVVAENEALGVHRTPNCPVCGNHTLHVHLHRHAAAM